MNQKKSGLGQQKPQKEVAQQEVQVGSLLPLQTHQTGVARWFSVCWKGDLALIFCGALFGNIS